MKKILAFIAALALSVSVTACGDRLVNSGDTGSDTRSADPSESQSPSNSDNEISEPDPEEMGWHRSNEEGFKDMIEIFGMDDIEAPDGEILKKADADYLYGSKDSVICAGYDFSYLRKVKPYFRNTVDEPDMINWETLDFSDLPEVVFDYGHDYIKIKQGDVLENGLKVKTAQTAFGYAGDGLLSDLKIELEGELTLEGILRCTPEDEYVIGKGELMFYTDCVKHPDTFVAYKEYIVEPNQFVDSENKFAMAYNGLPISLGIVDNAPAGVSDMFEHDVNIKAKVTLTDICFQQRPGGVRAFAAIKSVENL